MNDSRIARSTNNMPDRAQNEILHGQMLARNDTELVWGWGSAAGKMRAERRAKLIVDGAGLAPGVRTLEIGCGSGNFTELLAKTGATILAVDISPDLLVKARRRNLPPEQVTFLETRFEDAKVNGPFDSSSVHRCCTIWYLMRP